jgi:hypothetical protein
MGNPFQNKQTSTTNSTDISNTLSSIMNSITGSSQNTITPNEDPRFTDYRASLLPALSKQYDEAQKPVYGDAQVGQAVQNSNDVYNAGEQGVANSAARRGVLDSGAYSGPVSSLEQARTGGITSFMNSLPFLNEQAKWGRTQDLLGMATNFLGKSPIGQTQTGTTQSTQQGTQTGQGTDTRNGTNVQTSTPGWGNVLGGIAGGLAGMPFMQNLFSGSGGGGGGNNGNTWTGLE